MAKTKKTAAAAEKETKKTVKAAEVKAEAVEAKAEEVKAEEVKAEAKAEKKAPAKKAPAKKAAPKKTAPKKPEAVETKIAEAKPVETKADFFVEFGGVQVAAKDVLENIKKTIGKDAKEIAVYLKPEESKAYFVADGEKGDGRFAYYSAARLPFSRFRVKRSCFCLHGIVKGQE